MKNVKMNWVQTPYYRNGGVGISAMVSFDCFVEQDVFNLVKKNYKGTIHKNGKKTSVYASSVIGDLLEHGFSVELDGVNIQNKQYLSNEDIIAQSQHSNNPSVARLAGIYQEVQDRKNISKILDEKLDELFEQKPFIQTKKKEPEDINWKHFTIDGVEYDFDFKYGVQRRKNWEETSHESFSMHYTYRAINQDKIDDVSDVLKSIINMKPISYNEDYAWQEGFDKETFEKYEPKSKPGYRR